MPVPLGIDTNLSRYLQELEDRIAALENPQSPSVMFASTTANMPPAASYLHGALYNTTLNILAASDGTNWLRQDTGAAI